MQIKDAIAAKQNVTLWANQHYRGSRYTRIQLYRTDLHKVSAGLSVGMSFLWESHGNVPWDGTGINCYGMKWDR